MLLFVDSRFHWAQSHDASRTMCDGFLKVMIKPRYNHCWESLMCWQVDCVITCLLPDNRSTLILEKRHCLICFSFLECAKARQTVNNYKGWLSHWPFHYVGVHWYEGNTTFHLVYKLEALHASSLVNGICCSDLMKISPEKQWHTIHTDCKEVLHSNNCLTCKRNCKNKKQWNWYCVCTIS